MEYLKNAWYVAAWSKDISEQPVSRRYLNQSVMLFRKENGGIAALADVCPHRYAPLSAGLKCSGDIIQCGYHGLQFNSDGECVHNPHGDHKIPKAAKVRKYPVVELHSLIWIWMGDPKRADPTLIPNLSFLADSGRATLVGEMRMNAHYQLLIDNIMDLSHGPYVHASFIQDAPFTKGKNTILQEGNVVHSNQWVPCGAHHAVYGETDATQELHDQWWDVRWEPVGVMVLDSGVTPTGQPREQGRRNLSAHMTTPETDTTCHYFYSNSRDYEVENEELSAKIRHWQAIGFHEQDHPMLEAVQRNMAHPDLLGLSPIMLAPDAGAVRVRRVLANLIQEEKTEEEQLA